MINTELFKQAMENAKKLEEQHLKFRMVTCLTVQEAMDFYLAFARFPNDKEIKAIRTVGVYNLINVMLSRSPQGAPSAADIEALQSTIANFEMLHSARYRFNQTLKNFVMQLFKRKKK